MWLPLHGGDLPLLAGLRAMLPHLAGIAHYNYIDASPCRPR